MIARLFRRNPHKAAGARLYAELVVEARRPALYGPDGAPDTVDGRFDMIVLHAALLMRRLREGGEAGQGTAQAVFDAMFDDMDAALREMGVGDMSVGKKIKKMAEAFYGRASTYDAAIRQADEAALTEALSRNLFDSDPEMQPASARIARYALAGADHLSGQSVAALIEGEAPRYADPA